MFPHDIIHLKKFIIALKISLNFSYFKFPPVKLPTDNKSSRHKNFHTEIYDGSLYKRTPP